MKHPSQQQLSDYAVGKLPAQALETVARHLDECRECQTTIANLAVKDDTFVGKIKNAQSSAGVETRPNVAAKQASDRRPDGATSSSAAASHSVQASQSSLKGGKSAVGSAQSGAVVNVNLSEFAKVLEELELTTPADVATVVARLPAEKRTDPQAVARLLVDDKKLTRFQAQIALSGKAKALRFGDYIVLDRIGAGGMGHVYRARHRRMDRIVALKVISSAALKSADSVERFKREVKAAAKLMHPNIVTAFDAGDQDGAHYLVMEFVDGLDLASKLKQGKLSEKQAVDYLLQGAKGLAFAHSKGVVHRDIKPGNLLVDSEGIVKILDMGLARFDDPSDAAAAQAEAGLTQHGQVMGTIDYMAPEQALNTSNATGKADVYSLGCTLYRLLTGENAYGGTSIVEKILAHREQPIPSLRKLRPDVSPALDQLFARIMAKHPDQRPSMQEVVDGLDAIAKGSVLPGGGVVTAAGLSGLGLPPPVVQQYSVLSESPTSSNPQATLSPMTLSPMSLPPMSLSPISLPQAVGYPPQPSQNMAPMPYGAAPPPARPGVRASHKPPRRNNGPLIGLAAAAGAAAICCGVWLYIKDKDGNTKLQAELQPGDTLTIGPNPTATGPSPTAASSTPSGKPAPTASPLPTNFTTGNTAPSPQVLSSTTAPPNLPPAAPGQGSAVSAADAGLVCQSLVAKSVPVGLAVGAIPFTGPPANGRSGANGFVVSKPDWQTQGNAFRFDYIFSGSAAGMQIVHPFRNGHVRIQLRHDTISLSTGGAWGPQDSNVYGWRGRTLPLSPAATGVMPMADANAYQVVSSVDAAGVYSLSINGTVVTAAKVDAVQPQQMNPPFDDPNCPPMLAAGQAALIIGPRDDGRNEATNIRLTAADGSGPGATPSKYSVPPPLASGQEAQLRPGLAGMTYMRRSLAPIPDENRIEPAELGDPMPGGAIVASTIDVTTPRDAGVVLLGYLKVDVPGEYTFNSNSAWDRNYLLLDGEVVCKFQDGEKATSTVKLDKKYYSVVSLSYYWFGRPTTLAVKWQPPGTTELVAIPANQLFHLPSTVPQVASVIGGPPPGEIDRAMPQPFTLGGAAPGSTTIRQGVLPGGAAPIARSASGLASVLMLAPINAPDRKLSELFVTQPAPPYLAGTKGIAAAVKMGAPDSAGGLIEFRVTNPGKVYLAASWVYDGALSPDEQNERVDDAKLRSQGFTEAGKSIVRIPAEPAPQKPLEEGHTIYVRECVVGDMFRIRTRRFRPPVLFAAAESPDAVAAATFGGSLTATPAAGPRPNGNHISWTPDAWPEASTRDDVTITSPFPFTAVPIEQLQTDPALFESLAGGTALVLSQPRGNSMPERGLLEFKVNTSGVFYLAASWVADGTLDAATKAEVSDRAAIERLGWTPLGETQFVCPVLPMKTPYVMEKPELTTVFNKFCLAGETYRIRTRKQRAPMIILPWSGLAAPAVPSTSVSTVPSSVPSVPSAAPSVSAPPPSTVATTPPSTGAKPAAAPFTPPKGSLPQLVGRMNFASQDTGYYFTYTPGKVFRHDVVAPLLGIKLGEAVENRRMKIVLMGSVHVPADMNVIAWHSGGSETGGIHRLKVDNNLLGSIGDDKAKNTTYTVPLSKGNHLVEWELTGGELGNSVAAFYAAENLEPLPIFAPAPLIAAAKAVSTTQEVDNSSDQGLPPRPPTLIAAGPASVAPSTPSAPSTGRNPAPTASIVATPRQLAERLLAMRSTVRISVGGREATIQAVNELPAGDIVITSIDANYADTMTDADLKSFVVLDKLRRLQIQNSRIVGPGLAYLKNLPELEYLGINRCPLDDSGMEIIGQMTKLKYVNIGFTQITDAGLAKLGGMLELENLALQKNRVTALGLAKLQLLPKLNNINLDETSVDDAAVAALVRLPSLQVIALRNSRVTDACSSQLVQAANLRVVYLRGTRFTQAAVDKVKQVLPAVNINING